MKTNYKAFRRIFLRVARSYRADIRNGYRVKTATIEVERAQLNLALLRRDRRAGMAA